MEEKKKKKLNVHLKRLSPEQAIVSNEHIHFDIIYYGGLYHLPPIKMSTFHMIFTQHGLHRKTVWCTVVAAFFLYITNQCVLYPKAWIDTVQYKKEALCRGCWQVQSLKWWRPMVQSTQSRGKRAFSLYHLPLLLQSLGVKWRHLGSMRRCRFCMAFSCPSTISSESVKMYWPL